MMNRLLQALVVALIAIPMTASAQFFEKVNAPIGLHFDARVHYGAVNHGVVVDNNGRVWHNPFGESPEGVTAGIAVLNPDGSYASFSPITSVTIGGTEIATTSGGRGIALDHEGHIIYAQGARLLRINSATGQGMSMWEHPNGSALTRPGVDEFGYAYVSMVAGAPEIFVLDIDAGFTQALTISDQEYPAMWTRAQEASNDGETVITALLGAVGMLIWTSEDLTTYEPELVQLNSVGGTIFGGDASSLAFAPDGMLWVTDEGRVDTENPEASRRHGLHVFDLDARTYYTLMHDSLDINPRGIGFYSDGGQDFVYVVSFATGYTTRFRLGEPTGVSNEVGERPTQFVLEQNYPNPFNPSTTIRFSLAGSSPVSLHVYDLTGRRVATLIDGEMRTAGPHEVAWHATGDRGQVLPSGTYLYRLEAEGMRLTRSMMLVK